MPQTPFLTPEETAELLRVNLDTVRRLLREGRLPGFKLGKQWRIRRADLDAFVSSAMGGDPIPPAHPTTAAERTVAYRVEPTDAPEEEDVAWLDGDLSRLGEFGTYDWGPEGVPKGKPIRYIPGRGPIIIEDDHA